MLRGHFVEGRPVREVGTDFGYSRQTFYVLRTRFASSGVAGLRDGRPGRTGPVKCTAEVVDFLQAQREADPGLAIPDLVARLAQERGVRLHRRTVERLLRRPRRKKTLEVSGGSGEEAASIPTGEAFLAGGGAGQALYEARRAEFLARVRVSGEHPPGLGPQGLAGLLVPVEAGWMIRCYGVPRPAWSGWADPRAEALIAAYRLLSGAGLEGVMSPVPPSAEQEADDAGRRLRAGLH
jgi:transposase